MMTLPDVRRTWLIFRRELTDALRDRRTLFMMLVLPVLMYPLLMLAGVQVAGINRETERRRVYGVMVVGLPVERMRRVVSEQAAYYEKLHQQRVAESQLTGRPPPQAEEPPLKQLRVVAGPTDPDKLAELRRQLETDGELLVSAAPGEEPLAVQVIVELSPELIAAAGPNPPPPPPDDAPRFWVKFIFNGGNSHALNAVGMSRELVRQLREDLVTEGIERADTTGRIRVWFRGIRFEDDNTSPNTGLVARQFVGSLALMLVLMALTGAFYPAIDLVAGEKERGTIETLLIAPATRLETVLGKFAVVWTFSLMSAFTNLAVLGVTLGYVIEMLSRENNVGQSLWPAEFRLSVWTLVLVLIMMLPLSALFSGVTLAISTLARSSREGQYYLTPVFLIVVPLVLPAAIPDVDITPYRAQVPVLGLSLAIKDMLMAGTPAEFHWGSIATALVSTTVYAGLAIAWSVRQFGHEQVLFREAEEFRLGLWLRHKLTLSRLGGPRPGDAYLLFSVGLSGMWFVGAGLALLIDDPLGATAAAQVAVVMMPPLLFALVLSRTAGLPLGATFSLTQPTRHWPLLAGVPVAAAASLILVAAFARLVDDSGWLPVPSQAREAISQMLSASSLGVALLVFAVLPGLGEELLCRGFLMAGLRQRGGAGADTIAVIVSAVMFGLLHYLGTPLQMVYASLLGLLIGWMVIRTANLVFAVVFHASLNGLSVLSGHLLEAAPWLRPALDANDPANGVAVGLAAAVLSGYVALLWWATSAGRQTGLASASPLSELMPSDPGAKPLAVEPVPPPLS